MEILDKCRTLQEDLEKFSERLDEVNKKLENKDTSLEEREALWAEEFNIVMQMSHVYQDLMKATKILEKKEGMKFLANRFKLRAKELNRTEYIDVKPSR